jgi:ABC-2 type transport system ATP-binding protein
MIEAQHLTKYYGSFPAIEDVSFRVNPGEIVGFLGPNGSGKTTTMRIVTGLLPPSDGVARIAGFDVLSQSLEARRLIGYMPETMPLYTDMTVREYLHFMGSLRGMDAAYRRRRIDDVVQLCRLEDYVDTFIAKLSKGFRQRTGIAQAIIHEPSVLILDEPTVGIDPIQVVETRQLIKGFSHEQRSILVSTHILPEASVVSDRVIIINEGRVVAEDTPEGLSRRLGGASQVIVEVRGPSKEVLKALGDALPDVRNIRREGPEGQSRYIIEGKPGTDYRERIARLVIERDWGLLGLQVKGLTLEEIFLELTSSEDGE